MKLKYDDEMTPCPFAIPERAEWQDGEAFDKTALHGESAFAIRLANSSERVEPAAVVFEKARSNGGGGESDGMTLTAYGVDGNEVGRIFIVTDSKVGLAADERHHEKLESLRMIGHRICELNEVRFDAKIKSKRLIATIFHLAFICIKAEFEMTTLLLEASDEQVKVYERTLGFELINDKGSRRGRSALMACEMSYADEMIRSLGGLMSRAKGERSLYPFFFTKKDEDGMSKRLLRESGRFV